MATLKPGWIRPEAPLCSCGAPHALEVYLEHDGSSLQWGLCANGHEPVDVMANIGPDQEWPFVEETAMSEDFKAIDIAVQE